MYVNPGTEAGANYNQTVSVNISAETGVPALGALASQRSVLGTSVQGPYGLGQTTLGGGNARFIGQKWTKTDSTSYPAELYTNQIVYMGELSIELAQIKHIDMSST